ncbi:hypothetical protein Pcinc_008603 [Petrolisthes cinctipes]|uniref:Uncharacterized protein n=1 Tax=Petrolisthes cinctipes TaxID=88211 RepID=A0AAE1G6F2_PETCI|nr:hypothetical protein Pcinc_008603 [Petrolisthes cinctipes]
MAEALKECDMWHVFYNNKLYIPSTSGSVEIGDTMKSTLLTAIACSMFLSLEECQDTYDKVWYDGGMGRHLAEAIETCFVSRPRTLIMEMVCTNRTTYDGLKFHHEIAVSYPHSALYLLGCYYSDGIYTPSYKMGDKRPSNGSIREPETMKIVCPYNAFVYMEKIFDKLLNSLANLDMHLDGFIVTGTWSLPASSRRLCTTRRTR